VHCGIEPVMALPRTLVLRDELIEVMNEPVAGMMRVCVVMMVGRRRYRARRRGRNCRAHGAKVVMMVRVVMQVHVTSGAG